MCLHPTEHSSESNFDAIANTREKANARLIGTVLTTLVDYFCLCRTIVSTYIIYKETGNLFMSGGLRVPRAARDSNLISLAGLLQHYGY